MSLRAAAPRPRANAWRLLADVAPEFGEWAAFFAATEGKRDAIHAGATAIVRAREADDLLRDAQAFLALVERARSPRAARVRRSRDDDVDERCEPIGPLGSGDHSYLQEDALAEIRRPRSVSQAFLLDLLRSQLDGLVTGEPAAAGHRRPRRRHRRHRHRPGRATATG